jgi:hypothetical protein
MADVKQLTFDARLLKVIAVSYPHLIQEAQRDITPVMDDLIMIREIHEFVCLSYQPEKDYQHKLLFIAAILRLFNPDALIIDCKLRNGLRSALGKCLGDSGPNSSYYISQARAYMKIKVFKATVATIVDEYLNQISIS